MIEDGTIYKLDSLGYFKAKTKPIDSYLKRRNLRVKVIHVASQKLIQTAVAATPATMNTITTRPQRVVNNIPDRSVRWKIAIHVEKTNIGLGTQKGIEKIV